MNRLPLVLALALSMVATLLPAAVASAQPAAQVVPDDQIRVGENEVLDHDDPRPTRGRDGVGLAVNPSDPDHIVMVNHDLYHFTCEFHTSRDGGATWDSGVLTVPEGFAAPAGDPSAPCSPIGHGTSSFQGAVEFGSDDNVYVTFGSAEILGEDEEAGKSVFVARSTDGGDTFATGVQAIEGSDTIDARFPDIAVYPRDGEEDLLVIVTEDGTEAGGDALTSVSEDGGQTWSPPVDAADTEAREIRIAVDPDGNFYVVWRGREVESEIRVARSTDGGNTWEPSTVVAQVRGYEGFSSSNFPRIATGPEGNIYVVWMEGPNEEPPPVDAAGDVQAQDHFIHPDAEVFLSRSTDAGQSWSDPVVVNDDPPEPNGVIWHQVRHPTVSVAPNGRVDVVWQDRRHWYRGCQHTHARCDEARLGDTYWAHSTDEGQTFSDDKRVTDRSHNNDVGSDYRQGVYWDFGPQSVPLGNDGLFVAWMDARRGNFETDALDIWYAEITLDAEAPIPERHIPASNAADLSVSLARHAYPGGSGATLVSTFATRPWTQVVVVNEDDPVAATAGGVLARAYLGPVLASPAGGLTPGLQEEVDRMDPMGAFVLGDTDALSAQVVSDLTAGDDLDSEDVERIGGTPAEMAAEIARRVSEVDWRTDDQRDPENEEGVPFVPFTFDAAVIVNPDSNEAVTAAALAANRRLPVLFVEEDSVPQATSDVLDEFGIETTLVVGGAVSDSVVNDLPGATRLGGADMAATSAAVAEESLQRGLPPNVVYVSDAGDPMAAALTGAAVGRITGLQLVVPDGTAAAATSALETLGVADKTDRLIMTGDVTTRQILSWACPGGTVPSAGFTDIAGNTHETAIECAAWYGITEGGPGGLPASQYGPGQGVRRDQMASFIARMIDHAKPGLLPAASGDNPFPCDVDEGNVHFDAIRRLAAAGVVQGGPGQLSDDCYGPGQEVRRDQMASFIHRAIAEVAGAPPATVDGEIETPEQFFTDAAEVHLGNVNALASEGIVLGTGDGYEGSASVRRDQMSSFVNRGLDYLVQFNEAQRPALVVR